MPWIDKSVLSVSPTLFCLLSQHYRIPLQQLSVPGTHGRGPKHNMASHHPSPSPEKFTFPSDDDVNSSHKDTSAPPVLVSPIKCHQHATVSGINNRVTWRSGSCQMRT